MNRQIQLTAAESIKQWALKTIATVIDRRKASTLNSTSAPSRPVSGERAPQAQPVAIKMQKGHLLLGQLLQASKVISDDQLKEAEYRSQTSDMPLSACLISFGLVSKDLLEAAKTMQIQIETGELGASEAHSILLGQKRLHDAHVADQFFQSIKDRMPALSNEIESFMDEIFSQQTPLRAQPNMVSTEPYGALAQRAGAQRDLSFTVRG